jgi:hypothetical protein
MSTAAGRPPLSTTMPSAPPTAGPPAPPGPPTAPVPSRSSPSPKVRTHRVARWLHVYASMIALLIVLFFGITGFTLNHPDWSFGGSSTSVTSTGTFPFPTETGGTVAWLPIAEYVRSTYAVKGAVSSFEAADGQGSIAFRDPGYAADLLFDVDTGSFELTVEQEGFVAVMNDLHKGRDAGPAWRWTIDIAAVGLVVISLTGLTMQLVLRKRRRSALIASAAGALVLVVLVVLTLR